MGIVFPHYLGKVAPVTRSLISDAYWLTDEPTKSMAARFRTTTGKLARLAGPAVVLTHACAECGGQIVTANRETARYDVQRSTMVPSLCEQCRPAPLLRLT